MTDWDETWHEFTPAIVGRTRICGYCGLREEYVRHHPPSQGIVVADRFEREAHRVTASDGTIQGLMIPIDAWRAIRSELYRLDGTP